MSENNINNMITYEENNDGLIMLSYGELSTKGKNLKNFIQALGRNVQETVKRYFPNIKISVKRDHIYVPYTNEIYSEMISILTKIPGIINITKIVTVENDIEKIKEASLQIVNRLKPKTFKIVTRRILKIFPMHSDEINREIATYIFKNYKDSISVDVHNPDLKLEIVIREDKTILYEEKFKGIGGYPVGVQGKALMLLSGGIDSPVASYLLLKRGIRLEMLHFASPPYTSSKVIDKLIDLIHELNFYQTEIKLHIVPFTKLQEEIYKHTPTSYAITLLRRMMMRIASKFAEKNHILVCATGESVGQVASQTLQSINTIENVLEVPMIRPLATEDKDKIIRIAKQINTYDISIRPYEDCCTIFSTKDPATAPKIDKCEYYESKFYYQSLVEDCLNNTETRVIRIDDSDDDDSF